ncbi:MAG: vacuolar-type H+-ATPase subunit H [Ruminococcus sp.]|nr:vacuolar-type H+-ATPase subunit H [Ruminococcus sp.]
MSIDEILEEMDELLDKSTSVPFVSHKKIVDGERMRELINDIRLNMPHELKEAKKIEFDCQRILNEAKLNAEGIIRKAEERAQQIVSQEAIVTEAKKKAVDILQKAQTSSVTLQKNAALSVAQMLNDAEATHNKSLLDIKRTKEKLQHTLKNSPALTQNPTSVQQSVLQDTPAATTKRK